MNTCTMAEPPMPSTGSVCPVLPKGRRGMPPGPASIVLVAGAAATAALAPNKLVPAAARAPVFRKSRRADLCNESVIARSSAKEVVAPNASAVSTGRAIRRLYGGTIGPVKRLRRHSQFFVDPIVTVLCSGNALSAWLYSTNGSDAVAAGASHPRRLCHMTPQMSAAVACCALVLCCGRPAAAADPDHAKLQGKWLVESFDYNGAPVERMVGAVREIKDSGYTLVPKAGDTINGVVKGLDSNKKPKTIDLEFNGQTLLGIYELDGDTLRLCYNLNQAERPGEFASKADSGLVLIVHKRAK